MADRGGVMDPAALGNGWSLHGVLDPDQLGVLVASPTDWLVCGGTHFAQGGCPNQIVIGVCDFAACGAAAASPDD